MNPKILVGCPTSEHKAYCLEEYANAVKNLTYDNYDILLVDNSKGDDYFERIKSLGLPVKKSDYCEGAKERIVKSRNLIRDVVLNEGYDYFFSLEQDVIPPKDVIERLLAHNKEVVSGVYFKDYEFFDKNKRIFKKEVLPLAYMTFDRDKDLMKQLKFKDVSGEGLIEISLCGVGCILIDKLILKKIKFRYVLDKKPFDDVWFCRDIREKGFKIYLDKSVKCKHLIKGMDWNKIKK